MGRTKEQQREYMREYRARLALQRVEDATTYPQLVDGLTDAMRAANTRIAELEEEVHHLKQQLARTSLLYGDPVCQDCGLEAGPKREALHAERSKTEMGTSMMERFNTRPFTPVPKRHP